MTILRVLLADDHSVVRAGLRALLQSAADMQVVGEAKDGREAVREAQRLRPDVAILDVAMPLLNGVQAARQIILEVPRIKVVMLSGYSDAAHVQQAVQAGVAGYLLKETAACELLDAVRGCCQGRASFSPAVQCHLVNNYRGWTPDAGPEAFPNVILSSRQTEILQLIAEGFANKQIAIFLALSIKTVEKHRQSLMEKLNIHRTANLTRYAISSGVVESMRSPLCAGSPGLEPRV